MIISMIRFLIRLPFYPLRVVAFFPTTILISLVLIYSFAIADDWGMRYDTRELKNNFNLLNPLWIFGETS